MVADDKSEIGNRALVVARHEREGTEMNKDSARHLGHSEGFRRLLRARDESHPARGEHEYRSEGHNRPGHGLSCFSLRPDGGEHRLLEGSTAK